MAIDEYKRICQEELGQALPEDIVIEQATALLSLINAIYRPIKRKWLEDYDKPRKQ